MHVVVADNGQTQLDIIKRQIEERGDSASVFTDGREAMDFIRSHPDVDAVLTGLELTGMPGLELCWEARLSADAYMPLFIIVMSTSSDTHKLVEALDCGADDYLKKPFLPQELSARLRAAERARSAQRELVRLATRDPLTGVCNRRSFFERAQMALENAPARLPVSAIMLDIDHFKDINDIYGHDAGDKVLRALAEAIGSHCPVFGRLGGEEFAAVLPGVAAPQALEVAEAMRRKVAAMPVAAAGEELSVTCSFGIAECQQGDNVDELLKKADTALYAAKRGGRNRSVVFGQETAQIERPASTSSHVRQRDRNIEKQNPAAAENSGR